MNSAVVTGSAPGVNRSSSCASRTSHGTSAPPQLESHVVATSHSDGGGGGGDQNQVSAEDFSPPVVTRKPQNGMRPQTEWNRHSIDASTLFLSCAGIVCVCVLGRAARVRLAAPERSTKGAAIDRTTSPVPSPNQLGSHSTVVQKPLMATCSSSTRRSSILLTSRSPAGRSSVELSSSVTQSDPPRLLPSTARETEWLLFSHHGWVHCT